MNEYARDWDKYTTMSQIFTNTIGNVETGKRFVVCYLGADLQAGHI